MLIQSDSLIFFSLFSKTCDWVSSKTKSEKQTWKITKQNKNEFLKRVRFIARMCECERARTYDQISAQWSRTFKHKWNLLNIFLIQSIPVYFKLYSDLWNFVSTYVNTHSWSSLLNAQHLYYRQCMRTIMDIRLELEMC